MRNKNGKSIPKTLLITIDGPAGAGKTSVSRRLAERLCYRYIDTGALYRGVAFEALSRRLKPENDMELGKLLASLSLKFSRVNNETHIFLNDKDITDKIRTPEITEFASLFSARRIVRESLLSIQRHMGMEKGVIFEGRDMGTVVFPKADIKFFLDASSKTRAKRRFKEMKETGKGTSLEAVEKDMKNRDKNDSTRKLSPLKPASDAIMIDSTTDSMEEVVDRMIFHIKKLFEHL